MIEVADSNAVYYYHYDALGSVVALSDSSGDTVQTYEYSIYGQVAVEDPNHPNPYMFAGRRFDIEIGLYYNRARYYNPFIGRFLQADPIGYRGGMNLYTYCMNRPTQLVDPSGLAWEDPNVKILLWDGSDNKARGDGSLDFGEAADDDYWDVKIDIGGLGIIGFLGIFDNLKDTIMEQMEAAGKEFDWDQITIEGLWIMDHGNEYGKNAISVSDPLFDTVWKTMGEALDENHGKGATIHSRQCSSATDFGTGSVISAGAQASGHSVTGSVGRVGYYNTEQEDLPDYFSEVGYKIATPVGPPGSGNYTVRDYFNTHTTYFETERGPCPITWSSNVIVW